MNYSNYKISDYDLILVLEIEGNVVDRRHDLTIGGLTLIRRERTYVLDFNQSYTTYIEDRDITRIECTFPQNHFEVLEDGTKYNEEFPECKFDLSVSGTNHQSRRRPGYPPRRHWRDWDLGVESNVGGACVRALCR